MKTKKLNEAFNREKVEIDYEDLPITIQSSKRDADDWDEKEIIKNDYTYERDKDDIVEYILNELTEEDLPNIDNMEGSEVEKFVLDNFDTLLNKYYEEIKDYYRDDAIETLEAEYGQDDYYSDAEADLADMRYDDWKDSQYESLQETYEDWMGPYDEFESIIDKYGPFEVDKINADVTALYSSHKGEPAWDEAYRRWQKENGEDTPITKPLFVIKDSQGNQLSAPNEDDSELWDRVSSMEARGKRGLKVVAYTDNSINESIQKTFSQWFDEVMDRDDEKYYPFTNYVKTFPNAEVLKDATAEDIKNNAHRFYDVYKVDSTDREYAFTFASEELSLDYDTFYTAWVSENPINETLDESKSIKVFGAKAKKLNEWHTEEPDPTGHLEGEARHQAYLNSDEFKEAKQYVIDFANECKAQGVAPVEDYREFSRIIRDADIVPSKDLYNIFLDTYNSEEINEALSPKTGDRIQMDHYAKTNNGAKGTVKNKIGELCWIEWDDGSKSQEIQGFLKVIKESINENSEYIVPKDVQDKWGTQPILHDEDQWRGKYKTFGDMWAGEGYKLEEASYGGAFDIEDDAFFTREELNEFGYTVCDHLNETFFHKYELQEIYLTKGLLEITVIDEEGTEFTANAQIDMRKITKPRDLEKYMGNVVYDLQQQVKEYDGFLNEDVANDIDTPTMEGPEEGPKYGISSLINQAIQDELKTIDEYNSLALNARSEGFEDIAKVIDEINTEENKHVGQLQEILKTISPNAEAIDVGEDEGEDQLEEGISQDKASELAELLKDALHLDDYEAETFEHDMNNLRGDEWIDSVKRLPDGTKGKAEFLAIFDTEEDSDED